MKINYCTKCILPDTRPNINFNYNTLTCDACNNRESKKKIDWSLRKDLFIDLVKNIKIQNKKYDCIIPVSGGKDSTWQVKALEYDYIHLVTREHRKKNLGVANLQN